MGSGGAFAGGVSRCSRRNKPGQEQGGKAGQYPTMGTDARLPPPAPARKALPPPPPHFLKETITSRPPHLGARVGGAIQGGGILVRHARRPTLVVDVGHGGPGAAAGGRQVLEGAKGADALGGEGVVGGEGVEGEEGAGVGQLAHRAVGRAEHALGGCCQRAARLIRLQLDERVDGGGARQGERHGGWRRAAAEGAGPRVATSGGWREWVPRRPRNHSANEMGCLIYRLRAAAAAAAGCSKRNRRRSCGPRPAEGEGSGVEARLTSRAAAAAACGGGSSGGASGPPPLGPPVRYAGRNRQAGRCRAGRTWGAPPREGGTPLPPPERSWFIERSSA